MTSIDTDKLIIQNEKLLNLLRFYKGIDRSELSRQLQLSMPTIYNAVDELAKNDILHKDSSKNITINNDFGTLVGISIGTSLCKVTFLDLSFNIFDSEIFEFHKQTIIAAIDNVISDDKLLNKCKNDKTRNYIYFKTPCAFSELKDILNCIFDYILSCTLSKTLNILSIGISCTGVINDKTQNILNAHNLSYLNNSTLDTLIFPDKQSFFNDNNIYVSLVQNSNASVIAEKIYLYQTNSIYKNKKNIISLYVGVGTGIGIYLKELYTGTHGFAGEAGHIKSPVYESEEDIKLQENLIRDGILDSCCTCGSSNCYDYKIRTFVFKKSAKIFSDMSSDEIKVYLSENPSKAELLGKYLGSLINTLTSLLNIDLIIFTGKIYKSMNLLMNHIDSVQDENPLKFSRNDCKIITSNYGSLSPSIGAAIYSYHKKYKFNLSWNY